MFDQIVDIIRSIVADPDLHLDKETPLFGSNRILDSLRLVELCLALEDLALASGFNFDWTSEEAMSRSKSMFRDVQSLVEEVENQKSSFL
jgi:acyl carrier protein